MSLRPLQAFTVNMADARGLLDRAEVFTNQRKRAMRRELRERLGEALKVPKKRWADLDCLESDDVFVVFKPDSRMSRDDFLDHAPLLRQALVAGCAAFETYLADLVMTKVGRQLSSGSMTTKMAKIPLDLGMWMHIHDRYQQPKRGLRKNVVQPFVSEHSSTAPNKVGEMLTLIGLEKWAKRVDATRKSKAGTTHADLERITARRNKIAHQGDRDGRGRAHIDVGYVRSELAALESIVLAIEAATAGL